MGIPDIVRVVKEHNRGMDAGFKGIFPCPEPDGESFFEGWKEGAIERRTEEIDRVFTFMYKDWEKANPPDPELKSEFINKSSLGSWYAGREELRMEIIRALVSSHLNDLLE